VCSSEKYKYGNDATPPEKKEKKSFTFQENVFPSSSYSFRLNKTKRKKSTQTQLTAPWERRRKKSIQFFFFFFFLATKL
jgi:hypothetical protein